MRPIVVVLALLLIPPRPAEAGCACQAGYAFPHVVDEAGWFGGHCTLPPMVLLHARGRALLVEEYVAGKVASGELPQTRLHLTRGSSWSAGEQSLCVTRNGNGLYIAGVQALDLRNLLRTISDFGTPGWQSFCPDPANRPPAQSMADWNASLVARLERVLDRRVAEPDVAAWTSRAITVHEVGDLAVVYQDGALVYELAATRLAIKPQGALPVRVGNRYVLQDGDALVVVEDGAIVARHVLPLDPNSGCQHLATLTAHAEWVNVSCWESSTIVLTYSLRRNRFTRVRVEPTGDRWWRRNWSPGLFVGECG